MYASPYVKTFARNLAKPLQIGLHGIRKTRKLRLFRRTRSSDLWYLLQDTARGAPTWEWEMVTLQCYGLGRSVRGPGRGDG